MSTDYEKYAPLKEQFNPFNLSEQQIQLLVETQKQSEKDFTPLEALEPRKAPFAKKYDLARDVIQALKDIKSDKDLAPEAKEKKSARIWGCLSKELRSDAQAMKELCKYAPQAASLIPKETWTPELAASLLTDHEEVYDLLPKELQTQDAVVEAYRDSIFKNPHIAENQFHVIGENKNHMFFIDLDAVASLNISPACPKEKFFSVEGLESAFDALCKKGHVTNGGTISFDYHGSKRVNVIPALEVYIAAANQVLSQEDISRAENKALDNNMELIAKKCCQDIKYEQAIMPLLQKHERTDIMQFIDKEKTKQEEKKQRHETFVEKTKFPYDKATPADSKTRIIPIGGEPRKIVINDPDVNKNEFDRDSR